MYHNHKQFILYLHHLIHAILFNVYLNKQYNIRNAFLGHHFTFVIVYKIWHKTALYWMPTLAKKFELKS